LGGSIHDHLDQHARSARAAILGLEAYKPDLIKAFTDGWRYGSALDNTSMDRWTLKALTEEAHKRNWSVLTHTVTVERGVAASMSGVDRWAMSFRTVWPRPRKSPKSPRAGWAWPHAGRL
jgi:hypothetical protein